MSARTREILREVLTMPVDERAELVDEILTSLEPSDPAIKQLWMNEADSRVNALERGELETVSAESVFEDIERQRAM